MNGRTQKKFFFARSEPHRARRETTNPVLSTLEVERTQTEAGYTRTNTRGEAGPNAAQTLPKPSSEEPYTKVGPTSANKPTRCQEVANEKPFRQTTARCPISHRRWAMVPRHRHWYSGVEQPLREQSGCSACAFGFPKPVRGG